jgi:glyoxylase-like metal-dependent hydrolase (beta-lactamase superfamily II)
MTRADEIQRIADDLWYWAAYEPSVRTDLTCCAHRIGRQLILVDPIDLSSQARTGLESIGSPAAIILTNGNHLRASLRFRERYRIPIYASEEAANELRFQPDELLIGDRQLFGCLEIIQLPGAGPGEVAIYHQERGHLSVGDILIHLPGYGFSLLPEKYCISPALARAALDRLGKKSVRTLTFGHGLPIISNAGERLAALIDKMAK